MKILKLIGISILLTGCANLDGDQSDISISKDGTRREIRTKINANAWFSSAQTIEKLKATQTDKTQSFGTSAVGQQGATNSVAALEAIARILESLRP